METVTLNRMQGKNGDKLADIVLAFFVGKIFTFGLTLINKKMTPSTTNHDIDAKTRANLAYGWSVVAAIILMYIVYQWGQEKEILTLIIGLIGGTVIGGIFGIFFGGSLAKKPETSTPVTGDSPTINVNPPPTDTPTV